MTGLLIWRMGDCPSEPTAPARGAVGFVIFGKLHFSSIVLVSSDGYILSRLMQCAADASGRMRRLGLGIWPNVPRGVAEGEAMGGM